MPRQKRFPTSVFGIAKRLFEFWCADWAFDARLQYGIELISGIGHGQVVDFGVETSFVEVGTDETLVAVELHEVEDLLLRLRMDKMYIKMQFISKHCTHLYKKM